MSRLKAFCDRYEFLEMKMAIGAEAAASAGTSYLSFFRTPGNRKVIVFVLRFEAPL
jgi:hypothetical protein